MQIDELWVEIPGYPNYVVSNYGEVLNVKTDRSLIPQLTKKGVHRVYLYRNGVRKSFYVHRLVAQAFFVGYDDGVEVLHISENRTDNTVLNLTLGGGCRKGESHGNTP